MNTAELQNKFSAASDFFSISVQTYLAECPCDANTKAALDHIAHQAFDVIVQTQNALIEYLEEK